MRTGTLAAAMFAALLAAQALPAMAQSAAGSVQHEGGCSTTDGGSSDCADSISVDLTVAADAVGHRGAVFVAVLPMKGGQPISYQGAYAGQSGWTIAPEPAAYAIGTLPSEWQHQFTIPGGICARAAAAGAPKGTFGVFAGYGLIPAQPTQASGLAGETPEQLLREAEATGDQKLIETVKAFAAATDSAVVDSGRAAADMLQNKTVWQIGSVTCG